MYVTRVLSVLLVIVNALANGEEERNLGDSKLQDIEVISSATDNDEDAAIKRAKKSATTTFCVEIRPSGPDQRPFQVCEPTEPEKPVPTSAQTYSTYFAAPNYVPLDQPKPEMYKPVSQPKPNAVFSAPVKMYLPPAPAPAPVPVPKQYASHSASYGSYRSKIEDSGMEDHSGHLMKISHAEEENNSDSGLVSEQQLRAANQGMSSYGSRSYGASSYVPVVPEHTEKHRSHNGLVITCQPNLAGYAHNVPSSIHHPPALHSYSYRSPTPRDYNDKYSRYQVQSQSYGNYQQPPTYKPSTDHQYSSIYSSQAAYGPPSAYSSPHLPGSTPYTLPPNAVTSVPQAPHHLAPQPQHGQSYVHFSQNYGPVPTLPGTVPASIYPTPYAPIPGYGSTAPHASGASYSQTQSYSNITPGTYREAEEEHRIQSVAQQHKEKHTLQKMEELSHQRAIASQWTPEMSHQKGTKDKKDEHVESTQKGWSNKKRATEKAVDVKVGSDKTDKHHEAENEVNRIDN